MAEIELLAEDDRIFTASAGAWELRDDGSSSTLSRLSDVTAHAGDHVMRMEIDTLVGIDMGVTGGYDIGGRTDNPLQASDSTLTVPSRYYLPYTTDVFIIGWVRQKAGNVNGGDPSVNLWSIGITFRAFDPGTGAVLYEIATADEAFVSSGGASGVGTDWAAVPAFGLSNPFLGVPGPSYLSIELYLTRFDSASAWHAGDGWEFSDFSLKYVEALVGAAPLRIGRHDGLGPSNVPMVGSTAGERTLRIGHPQ